MLLFQPAPVQSFVCPASFSGIYSEDDYVNAMAQRAAHEYALAHARVQAIERRRDHPQCHRHPHRHQSHPSSLYTDRFAPASLDNFSYGFGPTPVRPAFFSPNRHAYADLEAIAHAYTVWQEEERQHALNRRREAIVRQREMAYERSEAQRRRALVDAARTRVAHASRIQARQAHILLSILGQLGLSVAPGRSAPVAPQANKQESPLSFIRPVTPEAPVPAPLPKPVDHKGKGRAAAIAVETPPPISRTVPVASEVPTLKEELQVRIRTETDPEVRESLVLLYSDLFDIREPTQPTAGPSRQKHVSFAVPISSVCASVPSLLPSKAEEKAAPVPSDSDKTATNETQAAEDRGEGAGAGAGTGAHLHRTPTLPPAAAAKLLKFYRARRARKLSLAYIKDVEDALRQLEGAFAFPAQLDFVDGPRSRSPPPAHTELESDAESALAYTANNAPVHAYEQALNELLTKLDAVESNGDMEVRGRRKEVVIEVERALESMERRIEESREQSRERARRGFVSSQASDPSITVTPHTVDSVDDLDGVKVAVVAEEIPVEVPAEIEEPQDASAANEHAPVRQVEASEVVPAASGGDSEAPLAPSLINSAENEHSLLGVGIPDSGADYVFAPSGNAFATHVVPPAIEVLAVPSIDCDAAATDENVGVANPDAQSGAVPNVAVEAELVSEPQHPPEPAEDPSIVPPSPPTQPAVVVPEAITCIESIATDATLVTDDVDVDSAPLFATIFIADTAAPSEPEYTSTQPPAAAPFPHSPASASSPEEETVLPLSRSAEDGEVEIVGEDELRLASNGSDWVDVGSETDL